MTQNANGTVNVEPTANKRAPSPPSEAKVSTATKKVITIFLKELHEDHAFNLRSKNRTLLRGAHVTDDDAEAPGYEGLARTMQLDGQDTPVDVIAVKGGYELRAGFRRTAAARWLAEQKIAIAGLNVGEIRATVHEGLSLDDQRMLNIRENVGGREPLTPPDLVWGILQLKHLTQTEIAERLGKSQGYISTMMKVGSALKGSVLQAWRGSPNPLPMVDMHAISQLKQDEQDAAYAKACLPVQEDDAAEKEWVKGAVKRAGKVGALLGELQREGFLVVGASIDDGGDVVYEEPGLALFVQYARSLVTFKLKEAGGKEVSKARVKKIADAVMIGYNAQLEATPEGETEEEEENEDD